MRVDTGEWGYLMVVDGLLIGGGVMVRFYFLLARYTYALVLFYYLVRGLVYWLFYTSRVSNSRDT